MADFDIAQLNVGRLVAPTDSPVVAEFMEALDEINAIADASPGFVWRFQTEDGNATAERPFDDDSVLVNFSTWTSIGDNTILLNIPDGAPTGAQHIIVQTSSGSTGCMAISKSTIRIS